ncbi:hypothetical protein JHK87_055699 [Glycine soja]|nr:hypothetical protein JHK87_055699 [Glycine soja]
MLPHYCCPPEALNFVAPSSQYITIQGNNGRRYIWRISMHNGVQCLAGPWYRYLMDNDLMAVDEVVFYFRPNQHVWELILRKHLIWDEDQPN